MLILNWGARNIFRGVPIVWHTFIVSKSAVSPHRLTFRVAFLNKNVFFVGLFLRCIHHRYYIATLKNRIQFSFDKTHNVEITRTQNAVMVLFDVPGSRNE